MGAILGSLVGLGMWWWTMVAVAIPVVVWLMLYWNNLRYASGTKLPPGHMGLPFFGEMATFLWYFKIIRRPDDFINTKRLKYGYGEGLYRTHLFGSPAIIACSPSANKFVFRSDDAFVLQWPKPELVGSTSLVTVQGHAHARLRGYVLDAINRPDALRRITGLVQPRIVSALQTWAKKEKIIAYDETKKVTFENIGILFASIEPGPQLDKIDHFFDGLGKGIRSLPLNFPGTAFRRALQCRKQLEKIFREILEKKKAQKGEETDDLMDGLMKIEDETGNKLSDQEVLDNIVSLVFAGYETTSLASMWAIYYLANFPDVLKKLREENVSISRNKNGEFITIDDIKKMKYTNKVVKETIRMANIAAIVFRMATKDVEYKGYMIPKGWKVMLWVRYLHTDPENFEDPTSFNPDRWSEPARSGSYHVFGGGSRMCPGNMFARTQVAVFLHHLSVGYSWELINPKSHIRYLPHPIPVDGVEVAFRMT